MSMCVWNVLHKWFETLMHTKISSVCYPIDDQGRRFAQYTLFW